MKKRIILTLIISILIISGCSNNNTQPPVVAEPIPIETPSSPPIKPVTVSDTKESINSTSSVENNSKLEGVLSVIANQLEN